MTTEDRPDKPDIAVSNTAVGATTSVQAHTITGGVHLHATPDRPTPRQLPPAPRGFVGRTDRLADLDNLSDAATGGLCVIDGTGGIGKTWLALTWAHHNRHRFPDGQLFADLHGFSPTDGPAQPAEILAGFLEALGIERDHQPTDPDRRADLYRSHLADKRVLLVLDNAATTDQVTPLLPGGDRCAVLVTSRNHLLGLASRTGVRPIHLDVLTDTEAHALLTTALGHADEPAITELVGLCGGFPLALGLIAARADPRLPLRDTVAELRMLGLDALDSEDRTAGLPTVLSWSLRHLTDRRREAFALLGVAPGPDIGLPGAAALLGLPDRETHAVLRALTEASLMDRTAGGRYAMHDLVRAYATTIAADLPAETRESALRRVVDFYTHTAYTADRLLGPVAYPARLYAPAAGPVSHRLPDITAAWAWFDGEHACLLAAQRTAIAQRWHPTVWQLALRLSAFHLRRGHAHDRLVVWRAAAVAAAHQTNIAIHVDALCQLGSALSALGHDEEAVARVGEALALAEHHRDHCGQADAHRELAGVWGRRGDPQRALAHAHHALDLYHEAGKPTLEAHALNAVGWYAAHLGDHDTAREHCRAALALHRLYLNSIGEAATLDSLGYIAHHSGRHAEAIDHYRQALAIFRATGSLVESAEVLDGLGHPHSALGQVDEAREVWREALDLCRDQHRDDAATRVQQQLDALNRLADAPLDHAH
ncbi:ATP-binding protein [Actinokineospora enzanensis]|uniref:ATP-binding protein n=1 Tax=Actinokineospora enzanensis TaxID=155975 RepID=UPI000A02D9B1|nr:tetratricopeptide repeat protein [Actinokineospora enzanensis]